MNILYAYFNLVLLIHHNFKRYHYSNQQQLLELICLKRDISRMSPTYTSHNANHCKMNSIKTVLRSYNFQNVKTYPPT